MVVLLLPWIVVVGCMDDGAMTFWRDCWSKCEQFFLFTYYCVFLLFLNIIIVIILLLLFFYSHYQYYCYFIYN